RRPALYGLAGARTHAHRAVGHTGILSQRETRFAEMAEGLLARARRFGGRKTLEKECEDVPRRFDADGSADHGSLNRSIRKNPAWRWSNNTARSAAGRRSQRVPPRRFAGDEPDTEEMRSVVLAVLCASSAFSASRR